jgi:thiol-disulfide isomerase/thioredoxin
VLNRQETNFYTTRFYIVVLLGFFIIPNLHALELPPLTHSLTKLTAPIPNPLLKLENMDEEFVDIDTLKGKTVVINFWATWCPPCRREMTSLEKLHLATKDKDVVVLAVNIGEDLETVFSFINTIEPSPTFPILFDKDSLVMQQWKVLGLPTTYIINPNGMIVYKAIGGREFNHSDILSRVINVKTSAQNKK